MPHITLRSHRAKSRCREVVRPRWVSRHRSTRTEPGRSCFGRRIARRACRQFLDEFADMALVDVERRQHADDILAGRDGQQPVRSEEHTSELQSLMRNSYAVFCLKKKKQIK